MPMQPCQSLSTAVFLTLARGTTKYTEPTSLLWNLTNWMLWGLGKQGYYDPSKPSVSNDIRTAICLLLASSLSFSTIPRMQLPSRTPCQYLRLAQCHQIMESTLERRWPVTAVGFVAPPGITLDALPLRALIWRWGSVLLPLVVIDMFPLSETNLQTGSLSVLPQPHHDTTMGYSPNRRGRNSPTRHKVVGPINDSLQEPVRVHENEKRRLSGRIRNIVIMLSLIGLAVILLAGYLSDNALGHTHYAPQSQFVDWDERREEVKESFMTSWNAYKKYAWGTFMLRLVLRNYWTDINRSQATMCSTPFRKRAKTCPPMASAGSLWIVSTR